MVDDALWELSKHMNYQNRVCLPEKHMTFFIIIAFLGSRGLRNILTWMRSGKAAKHSHHAVQRHLIFCRWGFTNRNGTADTRESPGTCAERGTYDSMFARSSWHACAHVSSRTWKLSVRLSTSQCLLCWQKPSLPDIMHTVWGWSQCVYKYWCEVILTMTDAIIGQLISRQGIGASFLSQHLLREDIKELQVLS